MTMKSVRYLLILPLLLILWSCSRDPKVARQKYVDNGNKYYDRGKYKEASIMYRRALQKDLRYGEAWYRLGLTNKALGIYGEAQRDFNRATELEPNNLDAAAQLADLLVVFYSQDPRSFRGQGKEARDVLQGL